MPTTTLSLQLFSEEDIVVTTTGVLVVVLERVFRRMRKESALVLVANISDVTKPLFVKLRSQKVAITHYLTYTKYYYDESSDERYVENLFKRVERTICGD